MKLGDFDSSGRRRPQASDATFTLDVDQVIFAVGQKPDTQALAGAEDVETKRNALLIIRRE